MALITELVDLLRETNHSCEACEFTPKNPRREFELVGSRRSDFKDWQCPNCGHEFQAAFCSGCNRAWAARISFSLSQVKGRGTEKYYCKCGELIHSHHRQ